MDTSVIRATEKTGDVEAHSSVDAPTRQAGQHPPEIPRVSPGDYGAAPCFRNSGGGWARSGGPPDSRRPGAPGVAAQGGRPPYLERSLKT
jgi:hypothetical protein